MKKIIVLVLSFIIVFLTIGCENLDKDKALDKYDKVINKLGDEIIFGGTGLNRDKDLQQKIFFFRIAN